MRCFAFNIFLTAVMVSRELVSVVWRVASLTFILNNIQTQTKKDNPLAIRGWFPCFKFRHFLGTVD